MDENSERWEEVRFLYPAKAAAGCAHTLPNAAVAVS